MKEIRKWFPDQTSNFALRELERGMGSARAVESVCSSANCNFPNFRSFFSVIQSGQFGQSNEKIHNKIQISILSITQ